MSKSQHSFRRNQSIETNLTQSYDIVTKLIEDGKAVDVLLLDQAKAFDKVVHTSSMYMESMLTLWSA